MSMIGAPISHFVDIIPDTKYGDRDAVVDCQQGIRKTFMQYKEDVREHPHFNNFCDLFIKICITELTAFFNPSFRLTS